MNTRSLSEIMQESDGVFEKAREAVFGFNYFAGDSMLRDAIYVKLIGK
ncbi:hypothetical protein N6H13_00600 [Paenibacillus sp. CC-CFT742]|nr:hypothetical protein [Paenibacillus sp. CC-CFT742]WJH29343.1 hypothetical protein N6H13_00600 [Paenibacillus sp. CC-CFT742]